MGLKRRRSRERRSWRLVGSFSSSLTIRGTHPSHSSYEERDDLPFNVESEDEHIVARQLGRTLLQREDLVLHPASKTCVKGRCSSELLSAGNGDGRTSAGYVLFHS